MNENMLVAVSAYAGDKHQVENALPQYLHHGVPVVVFSPEDQPIKSVSCPEVECRQAGLAGWIGPHTLERQVLFFKLLVDYPQDWFLFNDADSVCLAPQLPEYVFGSTSLFCCNLVTDTNPGPSLLPKLACQPPFFFHRKVLLQMIEGARRGPATSFHGPPVNPDGWPMPFPTNCIDHFLLQIAHSGEVIYRSFLDGASFETGSEVGRNTMTELARQGFCFLHSIKTKDVLDQVVAAYGSRPR